MLPIWGAPQTIMPTGVSSAASHCDDNEHGATARILAALPSAGLARMTTRAGGRGGGLLSCCLPGTRMADACQAEQGHMQVLASGMDGAWGDEPEGGNRTAKGEAPDTVRGKHIYEVGRKFIYKKGHNVSFKVVAVEEDGTVRFLCCGERRCLKKVDRERHHHGSLHFLTYASGAELAQWRERA